MADQAGASVVVGPESGVGAVLSAGTVVANNYRVVRRLGAGGMGTVYLGENTTLDQRVVIKVLQVGERGAGAEEARLLASLDHPNVVHVYAYDETWDCIVMQYLSGRSLYDTCTDPASRLDLISSLRVVSLTAHALGAVHERGVVHRDVKPENIMLDFTGGEVKWVKLIDLGTALSVGRTVTQPAGTPDYCGPEQFDGSIGASPANDIYALGVTLFLLCGREFPFSGSPEELGRAHHEAPVPDLVQVVRTARAAASLEPLEPQSAFALEQVGELVERMMAKDPAARPDAREVAWKLSGIVDNFSSERTHVGYQLSSPIPLTTVAKTSTLVLPRLPQRAGPNTQQALAAVKLAKNHNRLFAAIGLALVVLFWGLWFLNRPPPGVDPLPVAVAVPAPSPAPAAVDAGLAAAPQQEPAAELLTPLPAVKPPVDDPPGPPRPAPIVKKPVAVAESAPPCTFDDRFRDYARRTRADLRTMGKTDAPDFVRVDDRLAEALIAKDCRRASSALDEMRRLVGAPTE